MKQVTQVVAEYHASRSWPEPWTCQCVACREARRSPKRYVQVMAAWRSVAARVRGVA